MTKEKNMRLLLDLFISFVKIGLFTFGGGYAMIPLIERVCVDKKEWITHEEMMNVAVLAESTPGPIAVNCATYVGLKKKGLFGAAVATVGVIFPSFCILLLISFFFDRFLEIAWVAGAFRGIKIAVGILIVDAASRMIRKMPKRPTAVCILLCAFAVMLLIDLFSLHVSTIVLLLAAAAVSLIVCLVRRQAEKGDEK